MNNIELLLNILIIALLIPTITYAYRLNKSLKSLRENQDSLAKLVNALNEATFKAENSIPKLKTVTQNSSEGLKEAVDNAKELKDDLLFINERADNLAERLETVISKNRPQTKADKKSKELNKKDDAIDLSSKSDAEVELLKALRSIK